MPLVWSPGLTVTAHQLINHSSALVDSLTLGAHASRHLSGGGDALSITNAEVAANAAIAQSKLSLTADPGAHASRHASGGADAITSPLDPAALRYGLKKVAEVSVSADTTEADITGLDILTDKLYLVEICSKNPTATTGEVQLCINGNTTLTNYYCQLIDGTGTSAGANRLNRPAVLTTDAGTMSHCICFVSLDPWGYYRALSTATRNTGANLNSSFKVVSSTFTVTNITALNFLHNVAGGLGAGTRIMIYGGQG
jgi:hypothetical protein